MSHPVETAAETAPGTAPELRIRLQEGVTAPQRAHADDAGLDLASAEEVLLEPGARALVDTGMAIALPPGTVGLVCPRSGLAARHGVTVLNGPGVVDAGYRGPVKVTLLNTDPEQAVRIHPGDRIAQLVIVPFLAPVLREVEDLEATDRAEAGFGSTGGLAAAPTVKEA